MLCLLSTTCLLVALSTPWCVRLSPRVALWLLYGLIPSTDLLDGFDALSDSDLSLTSKVLPQGLVPLTPSPVPMFTILFHNLWLLHARQLELAHAHGNTIMG